MRELKIHVERIIRPIRGMQKRKNKMREELLQHMVSAYEEAVELESNDPVAYAVERLGDPDALRAELQDTVPRWERFGVRESPAPFLHKFETNYEPGSIAHAKIAFRASAQALVFLLLVVIVVIPFTSIPFLSKRLLLANFAMPASFFISTYLFRKTGLHLIAHESSNASPIWKSCLVCGYLISASVLFQVLFLASIALLDGLISVFPILDSLLILAKQPIVYLALLAGFVVTCFETVRDRRQYEKWGHLEIDG